MKESMGPELNQPCRIIRVLDWRLIHYSHKLTVTQANFQGFARFLVERRVEPWVTLQRLIQCAQRVA